jgi:hypothetical protein
VTEQAAQASSRAAAIAQAAAYCLDDEHAYGCAEAPS